MLPSFSQFDFFTVWLLVTSNDLWHPPNCRSILRNVRHPNDTYNIHPIFSSPDILLTGFWQFNLWWPQMTLDLYHFFFFFHAMNSHITYDIQVAFSRYCTQRVFYSLTSSDPKWPSTSIKKGPSTFYEAPANQARHSKLLSTEDIVCTRFLILTSGDL